MKKILKSAAIALAIPFMMESCVLAISHQVTGNPVGSKEGTVKTKPFAKVSDVGVAAAAKKGGITKIATVDVKYVYYVFYMGTKVTVTGE